MATELDEPEQKAMFSQKLHQQPRELLKSSKYAFETLARIYYLRHGFEALDGFMIQYLSMLASMAHKSINTNTEENHLKILRSTIILAALGLRDQGHAMFVGRMVFSAIRAGMRSQEIDLIDRYASQGHLGNGNPPKDWKARSTWAIDFGSISKNREAHNLARLFEKTKVEE